MAIPSGAILQYEHSRKCKRNRGNEAPLDALKKKASKYHRGTSSGRWGAFLQIQDDSARSAVMADRDAKSGSEASDGHTEATPVRGAKEGELIARAPQGARARPINSQTEVDELIN